MKEAFKKIYHGFLFGIGLGVAWWGVTYFATIQMTENLTSHVEELNEKEQEKIQTERVNIQSDEKLITTDKIPTLVPLTKDNKLEIVSSNAINSGFSLDIVGTIKNNDKKEFRSIELEAELFDAEGNFIYECTEYLHELLPVGGSVNFKVSCNPLGKELMETYKSFQLRITHIGVYR